MRIAWYVFAGPCVCLDKPFRNHRGMRLVQDGATLHTAHTTLHQLLIFFLDHPKSPALNPMEFTLDVTGKVVLRRGLVMQDNLSNVLWTEGTVLHSAHVWGTWLRCAVGVRSSSKRMALMMSNECLR